MSRIVVRSSLALSLLTSLSASGASIAPPISSPSSLYFEPAPPGLGADVTAVHRARGLTLLVGPGSATLFLRSAAGDDSLRLTFGGAPRADVRFEDPLPGRSHYLLGRDPSRFRTDVPRYGRVRLAEVWPGIDMVFHGDGGGLEYDLVVRPGADLSAVSVAVQGASALSLSPAGDLVLKLSCGELVQPAPHVYQELGGERRSVPGRFLLRDGGYGFEAEAADPSAPVVVDPYLSWVSILGGSSTDQLNGVVADGSGNAYAVGTSLSADFPVVAPYQASFGGLTDVVVTKLDLNGQVIWSTYLGGTGADDGRAIARDASGNLWIAGSTTSSTFPIVGGFQTSLASPQDAFVAALAPDGAGIVYSTFLGGNAFDVANAIAIGPSGDASVAGDTDSSNFPVANAAQALPGGQRDGFVARISRQTGLVFSTYLGGSGVETARGVTVDPSGWTHVGGGTSSSGFTQLRPAVPGYVAGEDGFLSSFDPAGVLMASTTIGGSGDDEIRAVAAAPDGSIFAGGVTSSLDFPIARALQATYGGGLTDALLLELAPLAASLRWSTYLGGSGNDEASAVATTADGSALVAGTTSPGSSYDRPFPTASALQSYPGGGRDAFLAKLSSDGAFAFSTLLGGLGDDRTLGVAAGPSGDGSVVGETGSAGLLGPGTWGASGEAFVARVADGGSADVGMDVSGPTQLTSFQRATFEVKVRNPAPFAVPVRVTVLDDQDTIRDFVAPSERWTCASSYSCETTAMPSGEETFSLTLVAPRACASSASLAVRANAVTPATSDPDIGDNFVSRTVAVNPPPPAVGTISGQASLPCGGGLFTFSVGLASGALPARLIVRGSDGISYDVYLTSQLTATRSVEVTQTTRFAIESISSGGCWSVPGGGSGEALAEVAADLVPPVVTAPPALSYDQSVCHSGVPGSFVLFGFVSGPEPSATDDCDSRPERLADLLDGSPFSSGFVSAGTHTLTYRYRDNAGNIGSAGRPLTVVRVGDLDRDGAVDVYDVVILAAYLVGNVVPGSAPFLSDLGTADTSNDRMVDIFDLVLLQGHVVGNVGCLRPNG